MSQGNSSYKTLSTAHGVYSGSIPVAVKVNSSGSLLTSPDELKSTVNSTTTPLGINQSFTGSAELNSYSDVMVSCKSDASGSLYFDFSNDDVNWDTFPSNGFQVSANIHEFHNAVKGGRYFRVRYANNGAEQTYFRLQTYYGIYRQGNLPLNQPISGDADATITRAVIVGKQTGGGYANVPVDSDGHLEVALHSPRLPFGSIHVENLTPIFQSDAVYGLNNGQVEWGQTFSGTATTTSSMFIVSTGGTIYSQAFIQSHARLRYRPGQGVVARFTALWEDAVDNSYQVVGVGHSEDGVYIGYSGSAFGILHSSYGVREQRVLNVTSASAVNQTASVTLDGVSYNIPLSNSNNLNRTAYELALGSYGVGWFAQPTGSSVLYTAASVGAKVGVFNISGSGLTTGSFITLNAGGPTTEVFVSQSNWSGDKLDGTGASGVILNPRTGNIYEMGIKFLGFGTTTVKVEVNPDGNNPDLVDIHTFDFPNKRTRPVYSNPSFPFLMAVYSAGSTANLNLKVGSYAGFVEGIKKLNGNRFTFRNSVAAVSTTLYTSIFTIMNSKRFVNRTNQSVSNILSFAWSCKLSASATGEFFIIKGGALSGNPVFSNYDPTSCILFDTASTSVAFTDNSQLIFSVPVGETNNGIHIFSEEINLQPGEWITVAMKLTSGTSTVSNATLNTKEDQ